MSDASATLAPTPPATAVRELVSRYNATARPGRRAHYAHLSLVYTRGAALAPHPQHAHTYGLARAQAFLTLLASGAMPVNPIAPDRDLLPPHHPLSLRAPVLERPGPARPLTAAIIIDALGRPWKSFLHPRDKNGQFIPTFGGVQLFGRNASGVSDKHYATGRYMTTLLIRQWAADWGIKQMQDDGLELHSDQTTREQIGRVYSELTDPSGDMSGVT